MKIKILTAQQGDETQVFYLNTQRVATVATVQPHRTGWSMKFKGGEITNYESRNQAIADAKKKLSSHYKFTLKSGRLK